MEKIKYICVKSSNNTLFTVGNIYEGYPSGSCKMISNTGYEWDCVTVDYMSEVGFVFIPLDEIVFMIKCTRTTSNRFNVGNHYFVNKNGIILGNDYVGSFGKVKDFKTWYDGCNWVSYGFELVKDYLNTELKEDNDMSCNEGLNKGIENNLVQDVYRAVTNDYGDITFNKVQMINVTFVKHDGMDKVFAFENKSDKRLREGDRVCVDTIRGEQDATVVSSVKIQKKYLKYLMKAICGEYITNLKPVIGVYKEVKKETLIKLGGDE